MSEPQWAITDGREVPRQTASCRAELGKAGCGVTVEAWDTEPCRHTVMAFVCLHTDGTMEEAIAAAPGLLLPKLAELKAMLEGQT